MVLLLHTGNWIRAILDIKLGMPLWHHPSLNSYGGKVPSWHGLVDVVWAVDFYVLRPYAKVVVVT